jgi:hypothetical protein
MLIGEGLSNRAVAERLTLSVRTVESYIYRAMLKTGTATRDELAALLRRHGREQSEHRPWRRIVDADVICQYVNVEQAALDGLYPVAEAKLLATQKTSNVWTAPRLSRGAGAAVASNADDACTLPSAHGASGSPRSQRSSTAPSPVEIAVGRYCARRTEREWRLVGHTAKGRRHEVSELFAAHADPQDVVDDPEHAIEVPERATEAVSQPPVVITEQQVAFSTAAAAPLPRTKPARGVIAALRGMFLRSSEGAPPAPRHYPPRRDEFLEEAAMAREMRRL